VLLIFKEAINNVVRHSRATEVDVEIGTAAGWLEVRVTDTGCGTDGYRDDGGQGLRSMRERAASLGGTLSVNRRRPAGTVVHVRVPLRPHLRRTLHQLAGRAARAL
jgi:signal transduction histidine kinase